VNVEKTKELLGRDLTGLHEMMTFKVGDDGVQHYQVEWQDSADAPMRKGWYDSKYNDGKFVPYSSNVPVEEADPFIGCSEHA